MADKGFDFYSKTNLKSYNLDQSMRYQLNVLDSLDVYTRKHCENVANITCRLCEYLHCSKSFTIYATICAYLHDVGKMFIPSEILQKPGRLTEEEYSIMKTHTTLGYQICMNDEKLRPYAVGARSHHEFLDGSGYPDQLQGKDIPYEAQIITVADEYDAIVSKRQYKSHVGISDTLKILISNAQPNLHSDNASALGQLKKKAQYGKINPKIVKALFKVVIDDTEYEISCMIDYVEYLKEKINRLNLIKQYHTKMNAATKEKDKKYYQEGIRLLLEQGETLENYPEILEEYITAHATRKALLDKLYEEVKIIKKLKV